MNRGTLDAGYFIFSLDTELAWGHFDLDEARLRLFSPRGTRERLAIGRLLALCNEYGITGTWAIVGHLFYDHCEDCSLCPVKAWQGKYRSYEEVYRTDHPLWYGADIVEMIRTQGRQEIAFHGYTHETFATSTMTQEAAQIEIEEWLRVARRAGINARSVVFPRNRIAYLNMLHEAGFTCYRSEPTYPWLLRTRYFNVGAVMRAIDHLLLVTKLPLYDSNACFEPMVNIKASQHLFDFHPRVERLLDNLSLHRLRLRRITHGIHEAARQKKMVHIWAHPWEFRTEQDFDKLRYIFEHVAQEVSQGHMRSLGMADFAEIAA